MFDRLRSKEAATISATLALGLGITACGSGGDTSSTGTTPLGPGVTKRVAITPSIHVNYFSDGTREINTSEAHREITGSFVADIYEFCVDGTYYAETENVGSITTIDTPEAVTACTDNKLTPSDFTSQSVK